VPDEPSAVGKYGSGPPASRGGSALVGLDARIGDPRTPVDQLGPLIAYRAEIVKQDEFRSNQSLLRRLASRDSLGKIGFSAGGVLLGTALFYTGHTWEGFLILGIGFHWIAPELTTRIYDRFLGKGEDEGE
jgi:hypothetical protein